MVKNKKKFYRVYRISKSAAFTLAEVLITLGIIGVVAAMTIPNLIANTQGARARTQLKKAISTLNQAARLNLASYDWDFAAVDGGGGTTPCEATDHPETNNTMCALLNANLTGETFLGNYEYQYSTHNYSINGSMSRIGSSAWFVLYQLADGAIIGMSRFMRDCSASIVKNASDNAHGCFGFIDVNGKQLPNTEIQCADATKTKAVWESGYSECVVKFSGRSGDVFPVLFYDGTVEPSTNAGKYVLNTSK